MNKKLAGILAKHATAAWKPPSDEEIIGRLAVMIVEEFSVGDAKALVRLFCTEGGRIGLELHEVLNAPMSEE